MPAIWPEVECKTLTSIFVTTGFDVPDPRKGHILVELKTANAMKLIHYCTSARVIAMPTAQLNARRSASARVSSSLCMCD